MLGEHEMPMPEWASGLNKKEELVLNAQLCTKDGRKTGNARIVMVTYPKGEKALYTAMTERGNLMNLSKEEVHELFWIGPYILKDDQ